MFCGTASFKSVDSDPWSGAAAGPPSSPCRKKQRRDKNPYAARGRDKFSALLAELGARRADITAKAGACSHGVATMVRFTYSNSDDWVPIIIKLPDDETAKISPAAKTTPPPLSPTPSPPPPREAATPGGQEAAPAVVSGEDEEEEEKKKKKKTREAVKRWTWGSMGPRSSLWPWAAAALMLLFLVAFGRVFAICCTAVWWYLVPLLSEDEGGLRGSMKKKDYGRRLSSKKHHLHHHHNHHHHHHQDDRAAAAASPRSHGHGKRSG